MSQRLDVKCQMSRVKLNSLPQLFCRNHPCKEIVKIFDIIFRIEIDEEKRQDFNYNEKMNNTVKDLYIILKIARN